MRWYAVRLAYVIQVKYHDPSTKNHYCQPFATAQPVQQRTECGKLIVILSDSKKKCKDRSDAYASNKRQQASSKIRPVCNYFNSNSST